MADLPRRPSVAAEIYGRIMATSGRQTRSATAIPVIGETNKLAVFPRRTRTTRNSDATFAFYHNDHNDDLNGKLICQVQRRVNQRCSRTGVIYAFQSAALSRRNHLSTTIKKLSRLLKKECEYQQGALLLISHGAVFYASSRRIQLQAKDWPRLRRQWENKQ